MYAKILLLLSRKANFKFTKFKNEIDSLFNISNFYYSKRQFCMLIRGIPVAMNLGPFPKVKDQTMVE